MDGGDWDYLIQIHDYCFRVLKAIAHKCTFIHLKAKILFICGCHRKNQRAVSERDCLLRQRQLFIGVDAVEVYM